MTRGGGAVLDVELLHRELVAGGPYARITCVPSVDSTNAELVRLSQLPDFGAQWPHLSVLTAEEQTGGRGRLARAWASPAGSSLSTSIVLRPRVEPVLYPWVSLLAGVALVEVLRLEHGVAAQLKWPNDVHVQGRKISGILGSIAGDALVIGIGVNVLLEAEELPTPQSTSVVLERERAGQPTPAAGSVGGAELRTQLLISLLSRFADLVVEMEAAGPRAGELPEALLRRVTAVMDTLGSEVRVELPDGSAVRGTAVSLTGQGAVVVETTHRRSGPAEGPDRAWLPCSSGTQVFSAGDVTHLRRDVER